MGFYDCRCMLTGVDLNAGGAVAVPLRTVPDGYEPVAHGISGTYDRSGTIDDVREDRGTDLVVDYFAAQHRNGRFVARWQSGEEIENYAQDVGIEDLLGLFERTGSLAENIASGLIAPMAVLDGAHIVHALVSKPVWDAIAAADPADPTLSAAFGECPVPLEIYGAHLPEVGSQLREMATISGFVRHHELRWAPPGEPAQRYPTYLGEQFGTDEALGFLAEACNDHRSSPTVLAGLDAYAVHLQEWIDLEG